MKLEMPVKAGLFYGHGWGADESLRKYHIVFSAFRSTTTTFLLRDFLLKAGLLSITSLTCKCIRRFGKLNGETEFPFLPREPGN